MNHKVIRILAMSDTHDTHQQIDISQLPPADIFIHAGDFTQNSYRGEINRFIAFLEKLPYQHKIVIAGNHDFVFEKDKYEDKHKPKRHPYEKLKSQDQIDRLKKVCIYLCHEAVEIEGLKIFGSPYQPLFFNWGFQYHETRAEQIWSSLPKQIDILITHGPPFEILDETGDHNHVGCKTLRKMVETIKPKLHIFGHVHYSNGERELNGTRFFNVSMLSQAYQLTQVGKYIEIQI